MPDSSNFPNEIFGFNFTEYLTIFLALVFALAMGDFFLSVGTLIRHRKKLKLNWEYIVWLFVILDYFIISWFSGWPRLVYLKLSLLNYFVMVFPYLIIYIIVAVYFPEIEPDKEVDLGVHFKSIRKPIFLLWAAVIFVNELIDIFMPAEFQSFVIALETFYVTMLLIAVFYDRVWYRSLLAVIFLVDMIGALISL